MARPSVSDLFFAAPAANVFFAGSGNSAASRLPRVLSGDEPHYLVLINSFLLNGDLELSNDYAAVHHGGTQAGLRYAGEALDDHTV